MTDKYNRPNPEELPPPRDLHGNKGIDVGNLESGQLHEHLVDLNKEMRHNFEAAQVKLSDFKPTQNVWKGHEKELDPVLTKGDLGKDEFFTKAFERQQGMFKEGELYQLGELHGNKGLNISNIESTELKDTLLHKHEEMAKHYEDAGVTLSDFKPTQNVQKGHEKDLDSVLVSGDLGKDKFFTAAFERQEKLSGVDYDDKTHHGNKGVNLGNLESEEMRKHIIDNNKKMVQHFKEANVILSDFKPTQNVQKGHEKDLDPVLIAGDLGNDKFFTKAFENQAKIDEVGPAVGLGNKGHNLGNLSSVELQGEIIHNLDRIRTNVANSQIVGDDFKPNHDKWIGHDMRKEPSNEEAFKGQGLEETLQDTNKDTPTA